MHYFRFLAVLFWVLCSGASGLAADVSRCRALREQRQALATEAMTAELALVRQVRERICSAISRQADQANANHRPVVTQANAATTDYQALIDCRQRTERLLNTSYPVLYYNRLGFSYYTRTGATLARQADAVQRSLLAEACPAWLRGEPEPSSSKPG